MSKKIEDKADSFLDSTEEQTTPAQNVELDSETEDLIREANQEKKFADKPIRTFAERAASAATFGLSDQFLVKTGLSTPEALRERERRNKEAALAGEISGTVGPLLASGGTSALAKGASKAGFGVKGISKAGQTAELLSEKALKKILKDSGNEKLAKQIVQKSIPKSLGSAVEGIGYTTQQLVKEDALGTLDENAENLAARYGMMSLISGATGGLFGSVDALVPVIKNGKVTKWVNKKIKGSKLGDKNNAAWNVAGLTAKQQQKLHPEVSRNGINFLNNVAKAKKSDYLSLGKLDKKINEGVKKAGQDIDNLITATDKLAKQNPAARLSKSELADRMIKKVDDLVAADSISITSNAQRNIVEKQIQKLKEFGRRPGFTTAKELQTLKKEFQSNARYNRAAEGLGFEAHLNRKLGEAFREEMLNYADNISGIDKALGQKLKEANFNYAAGIKMAEGMADRIAKEGAKTTIGSLKDMVFADVALEATLGGATGGIATAALAGKKFLESDFRRGLQITSNIEKANNKINQTIKSSLNDYINKGRQLAIPTSSKILLNTTFKYGDDKQPKPKTKQEAFKKVSKQLNEIKENPEGFIEHLSHNNLRLTKIAPGTAQSLDAAAFRAVNFLDSKIPRKTSPSGAIQALRKNTDWQPSTLELAKFERYMEAVENPMSALEDLKSGQLSREKIEAIKEVYPTLYGKIQATAMEAIAENADEMTYDQRLQLGILLDIPSDTSLLPANIAALQAQYQKEQVEQNALARSGGSKFDKLSMAESTMTQVERTQLD